ncbi:MULTISPECIES: HD domain-containing protein [Caballeronia]|uniref:Metal dependent phosphohydrolase n=1 Tax=Burkholderia vietnamiensis (strain G4 / LMG 22486) TaxID=269482 RepID=A4JUB4_BURVG|nr:MULTISPECIES: HD domain-containing protein [Caballeronia]ABO59867.1 metal dependent phosphohydrolase [Burkholderia vietnamiensis G4]MCB4349971.1 HD domain-containing protein [Burkholderia vietnamiensis]MDR5798929.1 HD domain-containing protein [Caballeronia sp. LZ001]
MTNLHWTLGDVRDYADRAHRSVNQRRKFTGEPYLVHPLAVTGLVATVEGHTKEMLAAAILHDVPDDVGSRRRDGPHRYDIDEIRSLFGPIVARYVMQLSNVSTPHDGDRAARMALERAHTAQADPEVKTIKLADVISNTISVVVVDREFAHTYLPEKKLLLEELREGDPGLLRMASDIVERGLAELAGHGN